MKSIPWGLIAFICAAAISYWLIVKSAHDIVDGKFEPSPEDAEEWQWVPHEIKPTHPGPYRTRVYRKHNLESLNTRWNGRKWTYQDGEECYWQERDWRALPGRVAP